MNEDKIIQKLSEHDEKLSELVTKKDFSDFKNQILTTHDEIITILNKLDDERIFTSS